MRCPPESDLKVNISYSNEQNRRKNHEGMDKTHWSHANEAQGLAGDRHSRVSSFRN